MGTNYYAVEAECAEPCAHCEQQEIHIGKSLTMFEAHDLTPWGRIESWQDWKRIISRPDVSVRDEYGDTHDAQVFITAVEATSAPSRRRQYDWIVDHYGRRQTEQEGRDFLDADGFSFHRGEFS